MSAIGPLKIEQLIELWKSTVDPSYAESLITAGEGEGFEVYTQAFAMLARVSEAIERTRQSLFIREWSGSADSGTAFPPATGAAQAEVTLLLTRDKCLYQTLYLQAGCFVVGEEKNDWGEQGSVPVLTGRKYILKEDVVIHAGESGPIELKMIAERPGYGYNIPPPNTITHIYQAGSGLNNRNATFTQNFGTPFHYALNFACVSEPDVIVPDNVGCYMQLFHLKPESGTPRKNHLAIWRMNKYIPADTLDPLNGGQTQFEYIVTAEGYYGATAFIVGESVIIYPKAGTLASGRLLGIRTTNGITRVTVVIDSFYPDYNGFDFGSFPLEGAINGNTSGGYFVYQRLSYYPNYEQVPYHNNELSWKVLSWKDDLGISVTNPLSPTGGQTEWLDELGRERNVIRSLGEGDSIYRDRVAAIADVVTPNAIRRNVNNIVGKIGLSCCLREVGTDRFPGFFFDQSAFDHQPTDNTWAYGKFETWMDLLEFRGFFLVGIPPIEMGDFGFAFDATTGYINAYDWTRADPLTSSAFDGYAVDTTSILENVRQTVDSIRAAGVGFELYSETNSCN